MATSISDRAASKSEQARAVATRQRLLDAAVDLFIANGYAATGLTDVAVHAEVTTGAFYYHFATKEALGRAVVDQGWPKVVAELTRCLDVRAPGLENVITMTFRVSDMMSNDPEVWIANNLCQTFGYSGDDVRESSTTQANGFISRVAEALSGTELRGGVSADQVGGLVWVALHGCHLLSNALRDDVVERLALSWKVLLATIVPPSSLAYFTEFASRVARQYGSAA